MTTPYTPPPCRHEQNHRAFLLGAAIAVPLTLQLALGTRGGATVIVVPSPPAVQVPVAQRAGPGAVPVGPPRCGPEPAQRAADPTPEQTTVAPSTPPPPTVAAVAGTPAFARWGTGWYPVSDLGVTCGDIHRIHFTGYGDEWDELAPARDLRTAQQGRGPSVASVPDEPIGARAVGTHEVLARGTGVMVSWGGTWYPSRVIAARGPDAIRIHYDGYGSDEDETVPRARVRVGHSPQASGTVGEPGDVGVPETATLHAGQSLFVRSGGAWYRGRVVGDECGGLVRVQYDGWSSVWNEVVPRDRLRQMQ